MLVPVLAGLTLTSMAFLAVRQESEALRTLAQAERDFALRCGKVGLKKSFLENFATDGVMFGPQPTRAYDDLKTQPDETPPLKTLLEWWPETGDVAASGDLGYTTGPFRMRQVEPDKTLHSGSYFSVWRRDGKGRWKVVLDFGTGAKEDKGDPMQAKFRPAPDFHDKAPAPVGDKPAEGEKILEAERQFALIAKTIPLADAVANFGSASVRVHRNGHEPGIGAAGAHAVLGGLGKTTEWVPMGSGISKAADLGYSYGRYTVEGADGNPVKGFFARVWRRLPTGAWRIVADIANVQRAASH